MRSGIRIPSGFVTKYQLPERAVKEAITTPKFTKKQEKSLAELRNIIAPRDLLKWVENEGEDFGLYIAKGKGDDFKIITRKEGRILGHAPIKKSKSDESYGHKSAGIIVRIRKYVEEGKLPTISGQEVK